MKKTNVILQVSSRLSLMALLAMLAFLFVGIQNVSAQELLSGSEVVEGPTYIDSDLAITRIDEDIQLIQWNQENHPKRDENPDLVKRGDIAIKYLQLMKIQILQGKGVQPALYDAIHGFQTEVTATSQKDENQLKRMRRYMHERYTI